MLNASFQETDEVRASGHIQMLPLDFKKLILLPCATRLMSESWISAVVPSAVSGLNGSVDKAGLWCSCDLQTAESGFI